MTSVDKNSSLLSLAIWLAAAKSWLSRWLIVWPYWTLLPDTTLIASISLLTSWRNSSIGTPISS